MIQPYCDLQPQFSVLNLKAHYRARRYLTETIKLLPDPHLVLRIWRQLARLGGIRSRQNDAFAA